MSSLPANPSPSVRRRNPSLYPPQDAPGLVPVDLEMVNHTQTPPKRLRQSHKPLLNRLESRFLSEVLKSQWKVVIAQSIRFKLGNGIWYKPDFIAVPMGLESQDARLRAYEVKGPKAFRGGFENLKVAAHQYPFVVWTLAWEEDGAWKEQRVLP